MSSVSSPGTLPHLRVRLRGYLPFAPAVGLEPPGSRPCRPRLRALARIGAPPARPCWAARPARAGGPFERVEALRSNLSRRYKRLIDLGAGCGMRQGEVLGLAVDDIDFDKEIVRVRRQIMIVRAKLVFAEPEGRKTREVPLPLRSPNDSANTSRNLRQDQFHCRGKRRRVSRSRQT
ncbi:tyrosine-type recombinase/integrase [Krasilnikovia sp. M28-CT-15]|uniref:tyrosine-type recombinase/integrase n=1 Tax=Krasilnikovia sp. M28-CT-15 TaxID=3373540 RepID=UPI00399C9597